MTLREVAGAIPGARVLGPGGQDEGAAADAPVDDVAYRADAAGPGTLFCCIRGAVADGHDFAPQAAAGGAAALLVERPLAVPLPQVLVPDARLGAALAAAEVLGRPSERLRVVGVTGTNGKTTTAFLTHAVLEAAGERAGLLGTVEARVGGAVEPLGRTTPESVDLQRLLRRMADAGDTACAMEVSSHALAQRRCAGVRFAATLFTNLTRDHLDYHDDVEDYYLAKRALFARPPGEGEDPPAAVNLDDPFGRRLAGEIDALGFGLSGDAEVASEESRVHPAGVWARVRTPRGPIEVESPLRGRFNLSNVTGVVALGELLELPHEAVATGIAAVRGVPGRFEAVDAGQDFQVIVDYAHTPDSLENVLSAARDLAAGARLVVVFGCGGDRDRGKRPQMGEVASRLADLAVVTSDNPRGERPDAIIDDILEGARGGPAELEVEEDRRAAIRLAMRRAGAGDVVVVAGKGHEQGQERAGAITPFDDRDVSRAALTELIGAA